MLIYFVISQWCAPYTVLMNTTSLTVSYHLLNQSLYGYCNPPFAFNKVCGREKSIQGERVCLFLKALNDFVSSK
jgi:hypothetical protein